MSQYLEATPSAALDEASVAARPGAAAASTVVTADVTANVTPDITPNADWVHVCALDDIVPNTGVCAFVGGTQVAVFRVETTPGEAMSDLMRNGSAIFAIGNYDPNSHAAVLSRGLVGNLGDRVVVASPIYKQHFDLRSGECLEAPEHAVACFDAQLRGDQIWVHSQPMVGAGAGAGAGAISEGPRL